MDRQSALSLVVFALGITVPWAANKFMNAPYEMDLSEAQVRDLMGQKTMLHIGGNHRSGTTVTWDGLQRHPSIASFGVPEALSIDDDEPEVLSPAEAERRERRTKLHPHIDIFRSEGVFLQHVLPKFQLHHPYWPYLPKQILLEFLTEHAPWLAKLTRLRETLGGLGEYAFDPSTHLTETHPLARADTAASLFRQWGLLWDLDRRVLLEKSPSNARIPRLMARLWGLLGGTPRFVFVTRHPLMQAIAMKKGEFGSQSLYDLIEHWLAVEESLASDLEHLPQGSYKVLTVNQVAAAPLDTLQTLFEWLGVESVTELRRTKQMWLLDAWAEAMDPKPDDKYKVWYAEELAKSSTAREQHSRIMRDFAARVEALGTFKLPEWCHAKHLQDGACPHSAAVDS
mmetsp:Transcript_38711/g.75674  ORF Transcript_38711/g.75674 Transcript_38711/m.75674 type:complete len:398 (-) Transcript_38711:44-1237(-)